MSEFFRAPAVRAAMAEIQELQEDIMTGIAVRGMRDPSSEEGHLYINKMKKLLEKQRNFMFRLSLEKEDADAIEMKKHNRSNSKTSKYLYIFPETFFFDFRNRSICWI